MFPIQVNTWCVDTANKVLVATIGFDERPVIRAILRHGLGFKGILLLKPREPDDPRSRRVVENIRELVDKTGAKTPLIVGEVDVTDFYRAVGEIKSQLAETMGGRGGDIVLLLGGGMRSLVLETLVAVIQLSNELLVNGVLEVDIEGSTSYVSARIEDLIPVTITPQERRVLEELDREPATLSNLSNRLDMPKTTLWKILQRLEEKKLVSKEYSGKAIIYKPTSKAYQYLEPR